MDFKWFIVNFIFLMIVFVGVTIAVIKRTLFSSTDSALKKLDSELAKANAKQVDLTKKLRQADEELSQRKQEASELTGKMRNEAEEESKNEREKIIGKAREESEEIIAKAQNAKEKIKIALEKEVDTKVVKTSVVILNEILSENAKKAFNKELIDEFFVKLENVDMSRISPETKEAEIISLVPLSDDEKENFSKIIEKKVGRKLTLSTLEDPQLGGGAILKFGSMSLDGSIKNLIRNAALKIQEEVDIRK